MLSTEAGAEVTPGDVLLRYDGERESLQRLQVFEFDDQFRLSRRLFAKTARYEDGAWIASDTWVRVFTAAGDDYRVFPGPVLVPDDQIVVERGREDVQVTVIMDGHEKSFEMPRSGPSIVDAAAEQGIELPFSCKGGVCATCRTHLRSGQVDMAVNYGLEPWEVEQGFVLACQTPVEDNLVVEIPEETWAKEKMVAAKDASRFRDALGVVPPLGLPDAFLESVDDPLGDLVSRYARTHVPFKADDVAARFGMGVAPVRAALEKLAGPTSFVIDGRK